MPRVLVALLCGLDRHNWLNPDLALTLVTMGRDKRFDCEFATILDFRPHEYARNTALAMARDGDYSWCLQLDNDVIPRVSPLDVIASAPSDADVVGARYAVTSGRDNLKFFPAKAPSTLYEEAEEVAGGMLMIKSSVWRAIPRGPWFSWMFKKDSETLENALGEDVWFCRLVRSRRLKVFCHKVDAGHLHTQDISRIAGTLEQQQPRPYQLADLITTRAQR